MPFNARIIGANESESHYVYDLLAHNTTDIRPAAHSTDTHGSNEVNFAICATFGFQFAPRYRDFRSKTNSLVGSQHPGKYDPNFLLAPSRKVDTKLILAEEDKIKQIFASLATKATSQSVIVGKLSSYARRNRTKRALWELDSVHRNLYLLDYVDSSRLRRNVQRALNRGESYHKLIRAVSYANGGRLRVRTNVEQQLWSECSRLLANCVIHYSATLLSQLLKYAEDRKDLGLADRIKRISPVSWKHINFYGEYAFRDTGEIVDLDQMIRQLIAQAEEWKAEADTSASTH